LATPNTKVINNDVDNCFKYVSTNIFKKSWKNFLNLL
jgi:hypothetical protein